MAVKTYLKSTLAFFVLFSLTAVSATVHAKIIYVDDDAVGKNDGSSWTDAFIFLQDALLASASGDEIHVAQGIYKPDQGAIQTPGDRTARFQLINGVALRGGFAGYGASEPNERDIEVYETILSGDLAGNDSNVDHPRDLYDHPRRDDNSDRIVYAHKVGPDTILDGFTISGGNRRRGGDTGGMVNYQGSPTLINCTFKRNVGYGLYNDEDCNSTLIGCSFIENTSLLSYPYRGCALLIPDRSNFVIKNCIFARNYRRAIQNSGRTTLINCTFIENYGYGIRNEGEHSSGTSLTNCIFNGNEMGISNSFNKTVIRSCIFINNWAYSGGGMSNSAGSNPLVIDCLFSGNSANNYGGGMYNSACKPTIINCAFVGNSAMCGGAVYNDNNADANLVNCSFTGNSSYIGGAVCNDDGSNATLTNCILWGDMADKGSEVALLQYYYYYPPHTTPSMTINNCDVQGAKAAIFMETDAVLNWGPDNISLDPLFIDADGADNIFGTEDDNLRLPPSSPCIDKGDNSSVPPLVLTDLDGDERIVNGAVDMGSYEGPDQGIILSDKAVAVPEGAMITFEVALALNPLETVEVNISYHSGDPDITVDSGQVLIFDSSGYSTPQTVTLAAAEDEDRLNSKTLIYITADGFIDTSVAATEADNEPYPNILLVDDDAPGENNGANWEDAFTNLHQATIAAAAIPEIEEIWVAQGTYKPDQHPGITPGDRSASFNLVNAVVIKGGFAGYGTSAPDVRDINSYETILSGDLADNDIDVNDPIELINHPARSENSYHVIDAHGTDRTAVLDGLTVTGGNANTYIDCGGGIYGGRPTIKNCRIIGNSAQGSGGGVYLNGWYSARGTVIQNCTISGNFAGWTSGAVWGCEKIMNCVISNNVAGNYGGAVDIGDVIVSDCVFSRNRALFSGGAIYSWNTRPVFIRCSFINNSSEEGPDTGYHSGTGGALSFDGCGTCSDSLPQFHHCRFIANSASRIGGAIYSVSNSYVQLNGCLFSGNTAGAEGPALFDRSWFGTSVINCTMADNKIITPGPGIDGYTESYPSYGGISCMTNSIVWNTKLDIHMDETPINYCCIEDGATVGTGNIDADPCFVSQGYWDVNGLWIHGDYNLRTGSPCIDAGDPNYITEPDETDLDGKPRIIGGRIDMGPYEYGQLIPAETRIVPRTINLASKGNWITCYIWLPEQYNVADIEPNSIFLEDEIQPEQFLLNEDQQLAIAKFDREDIQNILNVGEIELSLTGRLTDGTVFEATDIIRVIDKAGKEI